jgi:hypothetical protein
VFVWRGDGGYGVDGYCVVMVFLGGLWKVLVRKGLSQRIAIWVFFFFIDVSRAENSYARQFSNVSQSGSMHLSSSNYFSITCCHGRTFLASTSCAHCLCPALS